MFYLAERGYRCVAHDRRGHGRSSQPWAGNDMDTYADDLATRVQRLDLQSAMHVGHATGGGEVVLFGAVPQVMVKSATNPGGLPMDVFGANHTGSAASRKAHGQAARQPGSQARTSCLAPVVGCSNDAMQSDSSSSPVVRPAGVADVDAMFRVRMSVKENILTPEELTRLGITPQAIAEAVGSAPCAWVAEVDGEVQGFAMVDLEAACLFAAFVLPAHEGRGLGRLLVQAAEAALFERHSVAWLETDAGSRAAGFYRRLGWIFEADAEGGDVRLVKQRP